jgi:multidrug resistance efflux pump
MKVNFESSKSQRPDVEKGLKIPYAPARRAFPRWRWYFVVLLVSSPLIFFVFKLGLGWFLASSPAMFSLERIAVNSPRPSVVATVRVREGDLVSRGDILATLEDDTLDGRVKMLRAEEKIQEETVPPVSPSATPMEQALALAREAAAHRAEYLDTVRALFAQGAATRAEVNLAVAQDQEARASVIRAEADLGEKSLPIDDRVRQARLAQIRTELGFLEQGRDGLELVSPCDARVLEVFARQGQATGQGTPLFVLGDPDRSSVTAFVEAKNLRFVQPGRNVNVRFPGNVVMEAEVEEQPYRATVMPPELMRPLEESRQTIPVKLHLLGGLPPDLIVDGLPLTVYWGGRTLPW